uniref:Uncharacterized protein n=1 Tax=Timema shepardi TaxID=629360 RepID=A0A7R9FWY1_TIMSH|nr:unnamed protein product [Timema shepardi]
MPQHHQPSSLQKTVMTVIANNFEQLCYSCSSHEEMLKLIDSEEYLQVDGPFVEMPSHLIEDMMEEMKHVTHLRRHHLHLFLTSSLTTWTNHGVGDLSIAFELLKKRCKLLRSVGMKCPNLVELNIASTAVTDRGIVQLCISEDGQRQCHKLARLVINDAFCITTAGAIIALQSLPNLREFDYENIFEAIQGVECWDEALEARLLSGAGVRLNTTDSPSPSSLQLTTLISSSENVQPEGLEAAVRLCPDAQSIILSNSWLPNEALYKLMAMENLTSISITNSEGLTIDFYDGILPLLCACGHHLQNLILANFTAVDITGLGKACPELKNLALSNVAQYESVSHPSPELFTKLQALELWSDPHADISLNMVKQLLSFIYSTEEEKMLLLAVVLEDKEILDSGGLTCSN